MRPMGVVVVDVDAHGAFELPAAADQEAVEAVAADGAYEAFGERICLRCAKRGTDDLDAFDAEDLVEGAAELAIAVVDREAAGVARSGSDQASRRACRVVQLPSGLAVQPAKCTRRLLSSRKKST